MKKTTENNVQKISWSDYEIAKHQAAYLIEEGKFDNEEDALQDVHDDPDFWENEFEFFTERFSEILSEISPDSFFYIEGSNMGWRHRSGELGLEADNASEFIQKSFPKTSDWNFDGEFSESTKTLTYRLSHHDAPTGEFYTVKAGFKHPADEEIVSERPVIAVTVSYDDYYKRWDASDDTGEWSWFDLKKDAISHARYMRRLWKEDNYKTTLTIRNKSGLTT